MDQDFSVAGAVDGDHVTVIVTGEVDMATADVLFSTATPPDAAAATVDLRGVSFFDSAAIHALTRLAEHYPSGRLTVFPSSRVLRVLEISGLAGQPWLKPDSAGAAE
ncbi:anti-anti-sigma factor [Actinoplanes lutulentus]|uniref:STAS domain-containing protein n=1 Tax=Actinoplanes lutulentus TaxID=1287878 RepID=UPI000DBA0CF1|nr:STAS domain-containing protein [Actinoplanes lutulentus]MBB2942265.1 anti-anti-sigma factor [Actinoplanes lutulentus]